MKRKYEIRKRKDGKMAIFSLTSGKQISDWYDEIYFSLRLERMGYFLVRRDDKWAIFDLRGNQISDWFDKIDHAGETFYLGKIKRKWDMYDYKGNRIPFNFKKLSSLDWFDEIKPLTGDLYLFRKDWKYAIFNFQTGEKLSDWYDEIELIEGTNIYIASSNDGFAFFDLKGNQLSDWLDGFFIGVEGFITHLEGITFKIKKNPKAKYNLYIGMKDNKYAIFDFNGKQLSDWFDGILTNLLSSLEDKYYIGILNKEWAIYDLDGRPVSRDFSIELLENVEEIRFDKGILELFDRDGNLINRIKFYKEDFLDYTKLLNI
ncbi:MAG: hypothetical protein ACP5P7_07035 [Sulfurihydrogenibium sp.]